MRFVPILLATALLAGMAQAQTQTPAASAAPAPAAQATPSAPAQAAPAAASSGTAAPRRARRTLAQRFDAANTTHDGRLTLAQARAGHLNAVARDFSAIDKGHKGYVTMDDIRAHNREVRAAKRAARASNSG